MGRGRSRGWETPDEDALRRGEDEVKTRIVGGKSVKKALKKAARETGYRVEDFVPISFEQMQRMPQGSVEVGFLSKYGQFYGVLAKGAAH